MIIFNIKITNYCCYTWKLRVLTFSFCLVTRFVLFRGCNVKSFSEITTNIRVFLKVALYQVGQRRNPSFLIFFICCNSSIVHNLYLITLLLSFKFWKPDFSCAYANLDLGHFLTSIRLILLDCLQKNIC